MKLCLKCYSLWPRSAVFCGTCRRPLGIKRCPKGHTHPLWSPATVCLTCNEGPLDGVPCLSLGWVVGLFSLFLMLEVFHWVEHHPGLCFCLLWRAGLWILSILFDTTPCRVNLALHQIFTWYVLLWLLSFLLPAPSGRALQKILVKLLQLAWWGIRSLFRLLWALTIQRPGSRLQAGSKRLTGAKGSEELTDLTSADIANRGGR